MIIWWTVYRHFRATKALWVPCRRSMRAWMHVHALGRDPFPEERTASMISSGGGEDEPWVVARMIPRRMEEVWRLVDNAVFIKETLSLRMPKNSLDFFRRPINSTEICERINRSNYRDTIVQRRFKRTCVCCITFFLLLFILFRLSIYPRKRVNYEVITNNVVYWYRIEAVHFQRLHHFHLEFVECRLN